MNGIDLDLVTNGLKVIGNIYYCTNGLSIFVAVRIETEGVINVRKLK